MTDRELRSRRLLVGVVLAALVLIAAYSWFNLGSAQAEASQARQSLADCRTLIDSIGELSKKPTTVSQESSSRETISELVTDAMDEVGLPAESLRTVKPDGTERIGSSDYENVKQRIFLENVTVAQILQIARLLESRSDTNGAAGDPSEPESAETAGLRMRDLTLSVNAESTAGDELWNAEAVLTQTVFSPKKR